jgi:hypothetical protein
MTIIALKPAQSFQLKSLLLSASKMLAIFAVQDCMKFTRRRRHGSADSAASTTANPTPVVGAANITLGAASAFDGSSFILTPTSLPGTGETFSGVPEGSAYQATQNWGGPRPAPVPATVPTRYSGSWRH